MSTRHPHIPRRPAGWLQTWIEHWQLALEAAGRVDRTVTMYADSVQVFAGWLCHHHAEVDEVEDIGKAHLRKFFVWLQRGSDERCPHDLTAAVRGGCPGYGKGYVNQLARALQQFFKWWAEEEDCPNPMLGLAVPAGHKIGEKVPPVLETEQLSALIKGAEKGRDFESRRDAALLRLFACTGCRLSELALLKVDAVDMANRQFTVTGKGGKERTVRFDAKAAMALSRYLRQREKRKAAATTERLWIGHRASGGMTPNGIRQVIERRGERLGLDIYPHMFRHTFAHRWLDNEGAEGDLMALAGWESPQMLRHYGASAKAARARRAYDRINVMGEV